MTRLRISIKTLSPLYAGATKPYGSFLETYREISGALLRGAIAQQTLSDCAAPELLTNHEACDAKDLCPFYYLTTDVAFPTCAVADVGRPTETPLRTMATCKAAPGFAAESKPQEPKHGVFDTLLDHLAFGELRRLGHPPSQLPPLRCAECCAPLEPYGRRYVRERQGRYHAAPTLTTHRMTRVGINRRRETAESGLLYSVQSVTGTVTDGRHQPAATFMGIFTPPESWDESRVEEFKNLLTGINRLGGEQTYGLGRVEITVKEVNDESEDVPVRITDFNEKLREVWSKYATGEAPQEPEGYYFTVDLLTPTILSLPDGTPSVHLTAAMLKTRAEMLGFRDFPELEDVCCPDATGSSRPLIFTAPVTVSGWSEAWGLPKPTALAAVAGSVYVFRTEDANKWRDALTEIEARGIGARREEGFGAVRVCDPFHLEVMSV